MVKYTFLLPAFKPDFLEVALRSIKDQTYSDFKVLVSDDCSPHDLKSIYNKVCGDDERFCYRRNEVNMGSKSLVSHWNLLVDMCDTEYFILASDDDVYEPTFLEEVDKLAVKYPEVDLIRARVRLINEKGETLAKDAMYEEKVDELGFWCQKHFNNAIRCIANYIFRTNVLRGKGGFVEFPLAWHSDDATVLMMSGNGVANTQKMLFYFRNSTVNISCRKNKSKDFYLKAKASMLYEKWFHVNYSVLKEKFYNTGIRDCDFWLIYSEQSKLHYGDFTSNGLKCNISDYVKLLRFFPSLKKRIKMLYKYFIVRL